jgi:hypothetical protein
MLGRLLGFAPVAVLLTITPGAATALVIRDAVGRGQPSRVPRHRRQLDRRARLGVRVESWALPASAATTARRASPFSAARVITGPPDRSQSRRGWTRPVTGLQCRPSSRATHEAGAGAAIGQTAALGGRRWTLVGEDRSFTAAGSRSDVDGSPRLLDAGLWLVSRLISTGVWRRSARRGVDGDDSVG